MREQAPEAVMIYLMLPPISVFSLMFDFAICCVTSVKKVLRTNSLIICSLFQ